VASPVTIFTDHQDSLPQRETGFLQFYLGTCQEIFDSILIAYRVAEDERVLLPVMVCFDGFFLSDISEPVELPDQALVQRFIPKKGTKTPILDVRNPKSFNVMAFPDTFEEFQRDKYESMAAAETVFDEACTEFEAIFGRKHARLDTYRADDAEYLLVGLGSMMGTARDCVDELRAEGRKVGLTRIICYRPFPVRELLEVCRPCKAIGVLDRDIAYGTGGILYQDVCRSLYNGRIEGFAANFILGLGGRDVTKTTIKTCYEKIMQYDSEAPPEPGEDVFWPDQNTQILDVWKVGE
jgi:pyruvate ferredoxin oxidoreductase alpha subunit